MRCCWRWLLRGPGRQALKAVPPEAPIPDPKAKSKSGSTPPGRGSYEGLKCVICETAPSLSKNKDCASCKTDADAAKKDAKQQGWSERYETARASLPESMPISWERQKEACLFPCTCAGSDSQGAFGGRRSPVCQVGLVWFRSLLQEQELELQRNLELPQKALMTFWARTKITPKDCL